MLLIIFSLFILIIVSVLAYFKIIKTIEGQKKHQKQLDKIFDPNYNPLDGDNKPDNKQ